jgi:hypothetical protein
MKTNRRSFLGRVAAALAAITGAKAAAPRASAAPWAGTFRALYVLGASGSRIIPAPGLWQPVRDVDFTQFRVASLP